MNGKISNAFGLYRLGKNEIYNNSQVLLYEHGFFEILFSQKNLYNWYYIAAEKE
jgi:hypothetical protein